MTDSQESNMYTKHFKITFPKHFLGIPNITKSLFLDFNSLESHSLESHSLKCDSKEGTKHPLSEELT